MEQPQPCLGEVHQRWVYLYQYVASNPTMTKVFFLIQNLDKCKHLCDLSLYMGSIGFAAGKSST